MDKYFVTVDIVLFTIEKSELKVLLINRLIEPYKDQLALPGGYVLRDESLEEAAKRELREETGVENSYLEQLYTFGDLNRDPRGRTITVAYYALVPNEQTLRPSSDAADAQWHSVSKLPALAFDHRKIIKYAQERIRNKLDYTNVGFELLPKKFTLSELQDVHSAILGDLLDKRNFRRKILQRGLIKPLDEWRETGRKPAQLYKFSITKGK